MTDEQLTRLAAEKVMGWVEHVIYEPQEERRWLKPDGQHAAWGSWTPLTDWRAAGEIAEKMQSDGWSGNTHASTLYNNVPFNTAGFERKGKMLSVTASCNWEQKARIPRAITLAALLAVGAITETDLTN
jgi:hypothetical protein